MKTYYIVCNMTWDILSSFHYIFDEDIDSKAVKRKESWSGQREDAANWLIDERERIAGTEDLSYPIANQLDKLLESEGDKIIFYASDKIKEATHNIETEELSTDEITLYFYMHWLNTTLKRIPEIVDNNASQAVDFSKSEVLVKLYELVKEEIDKLEKLNIPSINESANRLSQELFSYWWSQVSKML